MPDVKVSGLPSESAPTADDYVVLNDGAGPTTKRSLLSTLAAFFFNQINIPSTATASPVLRATDMFFDHVASGMVWGGDAYASTRNASMTAGVCYINGRRISISAVSARTFTASKDTYIDILDNQDGTGTLVYTEVTNNAASPSLASNSIRIGIIVTGASNIANVGSVNQGQEYKVLPVASSIYYTVCDSLGNLICSRDPLRKLLGFRSAGSTGSTTSTTAVAITGIGVLPIKIPAGRKVRITMKAAFLYNGTNGTRANMSLWDGTVGSGTLIDEAHGVNSNSSSAQHGEASVVVTPDALSKNYGVGLAANPSGTANAEVYAGLTNSLSIRAELE